LSLLFHQERRRIGARTRECALQLRRALLRLLVDERAEARLRLCEVRVHRRGAIERMLQQERGRGDDRADREAGRRNGQLGVVLRGERECDPRRGGGGELDSRRCEECAAREETERSACERHHRDHDPGGEDDVEDGRRHHRHMVGRQPERLSSSAAASRGGASARSSSARSAGREAAGSPSSLRAARTWVESVRWARLAARANAAAAKASPRSRSAAAKYAVSTGNAPQVAANHRSEWSAPPKSSRLYATTTKAPNATNATSHQVVFAATAMPIPHAAAIDAIASASSTAPGMPVRRGRPFSSSRACAPTPIARK